MNVLDKGFITLVDHMGNDNRIVEAARGEPRYEEGERLIHYMMKNHHTSPFEKVVFEFHVKLPIFVARQWIRHRTGSFNEISARYSVLPEEFYFPELEDITTQDTKNRQGRTSEQVHGAAGARVLIEWNAEDSYRRYTQLLEMGVARELARMVLPLNIYTAWYWTVNLKNLLDFLRLRTDAHAQKEIREYANAIVELIQPIVPVTLAAWEEYGRP